MVTFTARRSVWCGDLSLPLSRRELQLEKCTAAANTDLRQSGAKPRFSVSLWGGLGGGGGGEVEEERNKEAGEPSLCRVRRQSFPPPPPPPPPFFLGGGGGGWYVVCGVSLRLSPPPFPPPQSPPLLAVSRLQKEGNGRQDWQHASVSFPLGLVL